MSPANTVKHRSAFTLVELLATIAIIGLLVGLLIPAVQSARESARRSQCGSNMRQIALGVLMYEQSRGYFPPQGWAPELNSPIPPATGGPDGTSTYSFLFTMLPFVEQQGLYDSFIGSILSGTGGQLSWSVQRPGDLKRLGAFRVPVFECPSDPKPIAQRINQAPTNYHAIISDQLPYIGFTPNAYRCFFRENWSRSPLFRRAAHVTDGLSNTMSIAEAATVNGGNSPIGGIQMAVAGWWGTAVPAPLPTVCLSQAAGGSLTNPQPDDNQFVLAGTGMRWYDSGLAFTSLTTAMPPNGATCCFANVGSYNIGYAYPAASSFHPAGVQVSMGDGSVRFVDDMIDYDPNSANTTTLKAPSARGVWGKLSTIAGNEVTSFP